MTDSLVPVPGPGADPPTDPSTTAALDLARVQAKVADARAVLVRLLQEVVVAAGQPANRQTALVLEANEALVIAALRSQVHATTQAQALRDAQQRNEVDALTRLPNRLLLLDRLARAIGSARRRGTLLALLFLDIDGFKQINDTLGHALGDTVLLRVARCLSASVREVDTVCRWGGDEFVILLTEVEQPADAAQVADKLALAIGTASPAGGPAPGLTVSIGISVFPDDADDADTLIALADTAMYHAKRHGLGSFAFHGQPPAGVRPPQAAHTPHERALAEHERRNAELREANAALVLAALGAQALQAAAEQAQRRQSDFMAVAMDELRNPQAPIRIATAMLGRSGSDDLLPRLQSLVERQAAQVARLVGNPADMPGTAAGTLVLERRRVDLAEILRAVAASGQPLLTARGQQLDLHLPLRRLEIDGDPARLAQMAGNLLQNASKHSHDGGHIGMSSMVADGAIELAVFDDGIGISALALPRVFEPFAQDTQAIGFNGIGLGIGLTVVRALAEAHGGSVTASSPGIGLGSRFVVRLPLAAAPARGT
jgi:diguanylate cyclase (GGDEF)-like protein